MRNPFSHVASRKLSETLLAISVWSYTVAATVVETLSALLFVPRDATGGYAVILALGGAQLVLIGLYFMHLSTENRTVYRVFLASLMFAAAMVIGVLTSLAGRV